MRTIQVDEDEYRRLLNERDQLRTQVTGLQEESSRVAEASLARTVRAFHLKFGHPVAVRPGVPEDEQVRFRLKLIAEEFFELLGAALADDQQMYKTGPESEGLIEKAHGILLSALDHSSVVVDLPELVDAIEDLKYVLEGTHAVLGVHAAPIAARIHAANMAKDAVYVEAKDDFKKGQRIKPVKPEGWKPPDVAGALREQGWDGHDGRTVKR